MGLILSLVAFPLVGAAVARFVGRTSSYLLGLGSLGGILYVSTLLHVPLVGMMIAIAVTAVVVLIVVPRRREDWAGEDYPPAAMLVTLIPIVFLLFVTAVKPLDDFDGRAFWLLKAKAIAEERVIDGPFFRGEVMYDPRNEYPLLIPLDAAAIMIATDDDEQNVRWIYVLTLAALALHARRFVGAWPAALIPWIPQFAVVKEGGVTSGYNDTALAAFAACAFFELLERKSPLRFGLWLSFLILTKNEGLPFALILLAAGVVVFRRRITEALTPIGVAAGTLLVWRALIPPGDEENLVALFPTALQRLERLVPAVTAFLGRAMVLDVWGLFWIAVVIAAMALSWRREWRAVILPAYVIVAMGAVYVIVYMVTTWVMEDLVRTSADRLLMHFIGPGIYLIGAFARSRYTPSPHPPTEA